MHRITTENEQTLDAIKGTALDAPAAVAAPADVALSEDTVADKLLGKLPALPSVVAPASHTTFTANVKVPGLPGDYQFTFDVAGYPAIPVFRSLVLAALGLSFFFLTLKAVKEAFA